MRDRETADAVARLLPQLTSAAVLLTDDPADAVRLLGAALSAPGALDDPDGARRAFARQVLRRPRWSAEQVVGTTAPPPTDDDTALAAALHALPDRCRAASVLHLVAGLRAETVAGRTGEADAAVARLMDELARRDRGELRERERAAAPYRAPGSAPAAHPPTPALPERLARLAGGRALPPAAAETIAATISEARGGRRRRGLRIAAGVVVAGLLLALVPLLPQGPAAPPTVYGGPISGSLAGDDQFLRAVREALWPGAATDDRRVTFAGDVPGGRWALVTAGGTPSRPAAIAWLTGPVGAAPERMVLRSVRTDPDPVVPVSLTDPVTGALVVVGAPGDRITLSARPVVGADGSITRDFRAASTSRGVAVVELAPVPESEGSAVRLRVVRDGRRLDVPPPTVVADPGEPRADVLLTVLRPSTPSPVGDAAVESRLRSVLGQLGQAVGATPVTALWAGNLPDPDDGPTRLSVLAVEQPSGAFVVTAPYAYATDTGGPAVTSWCGTGVLPAGAPLEQRVVALRCDFRDLSIRAEISRFLVVVGPRTAASVQLLDDRGTVLSGHALHDGVAVIRSPGDVATVSVTTAEGGSSTAIPFVTADLSG
jgi:hypothetical protein